MPYRERRLESNSQIFPVLPMFSWHDYTGITQKNADGLLGRLLVDGLIRYSKNNDHLPRVSFSEVDCTALQLICSDRDNIVRFHAFSQSVVNRNREGVFTWRAGREDVRMTCRET